MLEAALGDAAAAAEAPPPAAAAKQRREPAEQPAWRISSRPASEDEEDFYALLGSLGRTTVAHALGLIDLEVLPSCDWAPDEDLQGLVGDGGRNHFVCLQLLTMAREQAAAVAAARAAGDAAALRAAHCMLLATLSLRGGGGGGAGGRRAQVAAAAIFYPRALKAEAEGAAAGAGARAGGGGGGNRAAQPACDVYVELCVCNRPGQGLGSLLLQHIERFVRGACGRLSADLAAAAGAGPAPALQPCGLGGAGGTAAPGRGGGSGSRCEAAAEGSSDSSRRQPAGEVSLPFARPAAAPGGGGGREASPPRPLATTAATAAAAPPHICGIRLLSVAGAQRFYARNGFGVSDASGEMFKPLRLLQGEEAAAPGPGAQGVEAAGARSGCGPAQPDVVRRGAGAKAPQLQGTRCCCRAPGCDGGAAIAAGDAGPG